MKKTILLSLLIASVFISTAQESLNNSLSISLIRLEKNSQTIYENFHSKFMTSIEYQKTNKNVSFGFKYEHGLNKIIEDCGNCRDHFYGTGYLREDNFYVSINYSIVKLFNSSLTFNSGLGIYYSNLNYAGNFDGGFFGGGIIKDNTHKTIGVAPNISINYFLYKNLFISLYANMRFGLTNEYNATNLQKNKIEETVINAPELRIGVRF